MNKILNEIQNDLNDIAQVLPLISIERSYGLTVSAKFIGSVYSPFGQKGMVNKYKVTVKKDGKRFLSALLWLNSRTPKRHLFKRIRLGIYVAMYL